MKIALCLLKCLACDHDQMILLGVNGYNLYAYCPQCEQVSWWSLSDLMMLVPPGGNGNGKAHSD